MSAASSLEERRPKAAADQKAEHARRHPRIRERLVGLHARSRRTLGASPQAKAPRSRGIGPEPPGSRLDELFLGRCPNELRLVPRFLLGRSGLVETECWARAHGRR